MAYVFARCHSMSPSKKSIPVKNRVCLPPILFIRSFLASGNTVLKNVTGPTLVPRLDLCHGHECGAGGFMQFTRRFGVREASLERVTKFEVCIHRQLAQLYIYIYIYVDRKIIMEHHRKIGLREPPRENDILNNANTSEIIFYCRKKK